jgi:hypothetical protein
MRECRPTGRPGFYAVVRRLSSSRFGENLLLWQNQGSPCRRDSAQPEPARSRHGLARQPKKPVSEQHRGPTRHASNGMSAMRTLRQRDTSFQAQSSFLCVRMGSRNMRAHGRNLSKTPAGKTQWRIERQEHRVSDTEQLLSLERGRPNPLRFPWSAGALTRYCDSPRAASA